MNAPTTIALTCCALAVLLALRVLPFRIAAWAEGILNGRRTPSVVGMITAVAFWWIAGMTLRVEPISTDEASYLLQARLFASGQLTAPAPPIPEFFEQAWVIVSPKVFSKYPPGHALALAPGVALGLPWLMPFLLNLVSGALFFGLLRRAAGAPAALLVWSAWVLSGMAMAWQTTYFSEVTLLACWLGGAALVWRWLDDGRTRWLAGAALCIGYGAVTRPLSILLLALPLLAVVLVHARRHPTLRGGVIRAAFAGAAMLLLLPLWNLGTTGEITRSPLREYTETYLPWDRLGFAVESTAAKRPAPPDLVQIAPQLARVHREHTVAALPATLRDRAVHVYALLFTQWRLPLLLLAVIGVWKLGRPGWVILAAALTQFLGHAIWGHEAGWTLYYAESAAAWYLPGAAGAILVLESIARRVTRLEEGRARVNLAVLLGVPWLLYLSVLGSVPYRAWRASRATASRAFADFVQSGPDRAIYFVRYGPPVAGRPGLVRNDPRWDQARAWIVYDLGERNAELLRAAPDRRGFLVNELDHSVTPLPDGR